MKQFNINAVRDEPLPERPALVRAVRRATASTSSTRRTSSRTASSFDPDKTLAQQAGVAGAPSGPHAPDGRARQEPPVDHHLVARQRGGRRRRTSRRPMRGSRSAIRRGRCSTSRRGSKAHTDIYSPDVRADSRRSSGTRTSPRRGRSSCASMRTRWATASATCRTTGTSSCRTRTCRAASSGTGWTRAAASRRRRRAARTTSTAATRAAPTGMLRCPTRERAAPARASRSRRSTSTSTSEPLDWAAGRFRVTNRHDFMTLDRLDISVARSKPTGASSPKTLLPAPRHRAAIVGRGPDPAAAR